MENITLYQIQKKIMAAKSKVNEAKRAVMKLEKIKKNLEESKNEH